MVALARGWLKLNNARKCKAASPPKVVPSDDVHIIPSQPCKKPLNHGPGTPSSRSGGGGSGSSRRRAIVSGGGGAGRRSTSNITKSNGLNILTVVNVGVGIVVVDL